MQAGGSQQAAKAKGEVEQAQHWVLAGRLSLCSHLRERNILQWSLSELERLEGALVDVPRYPDYSAPELLAAQNRRGPDTPRPYRVQAPARCGSARWGRVSELSEPQTSESQAMQVKIAPKTDAFSADFRIAYSQQQQVLLQLQVVIVCSRIRRGRRVEKPTRFRRCWRPTWNVPAGNDM